MEDNVEAIIGHRTQGAGRIQYLVRWKKESIVYDSWEDSTNLECFRKITDYWEEEQLTTKKKPNLPTVPQVQQIPEDAVVRGYFKDNGKPMFVVFSPESGQEFIADGETLKNERPDLIVSTFESEFLGK